MIFEQKKLHISMHNLWLIMLATITISINLLRITLPKIHVKFQPNSLKSFRVKVEKVQKTHKLCIIMLIHPPWYNFSEKILFDLQINIDWVHPVQISSRSYYCISTDIMWKTPNISLKNRGLVPTIQLEPDSCWTCSFR